MCGIFCAISSTEFNLNDVKGFLETLNLLARRGPNRSFCHRLVRNSNNRQCHLDFRGQVLWQQGVRLCQQPLVREGHVLLLNGDVFTVREKGAGQSDTEWLMDRLKECQSEQQLLTFFQTTVRGPFSLVYFNETFNSLYIVRDSMGRQSLLFGELPAKNGSHQATTVITSVADKNMIDTKNLSELPPLGIFKLSLELGSWSLHPWQSLQNDTLYVEQLKEMIVKFGISISVEDALSPEWLAYNANGFSMLTQEWSFETQINELFSNDAQKTKPSDIFSCLITNQIVATTVDELIQLLEQSVRERCEATPPRCRDCMLNFEPEVTCRHSRVGLLFSGGLDCTILAVLADRCVPAVCPIDLLNVSFEKVRSGLASNDERNFDEIDYDTPDRLTARESLQELRTLRPERRWNLVEINITRSELQQNIASHIAALINPLDTVLDESLGAALWFAARGQGFANNQPYTSPARVLLHGSGADELFGGYTRHRNAYMRARSPEDGWRALTAELHLDWIRLPSRNLARDDRVIGDHGRTARAPYVQEEFVMYVRRLAAQQRCIMHTVPPGIGDKLLLRVAGHRLGLVGAAALRKRALQFGTRIADRRQNAKDKSTALLATN